MQKFWRRTPLDVRELTLIVTPQIFFDLNRRLTSNLRSNFISRRDQRKKMKKSKNQLSSRARFIFGAGIGIALSAALFNSIGETLVKFVLMTMFAVIMGYAQVIAGRDTASSRKFTKWMLAGGVLAMAVGIIAILLIN